MNDKETKAIFDCTELILGLDNEGKTRVMKYLVERFINKNNSNQQSYSPHITQESQENKEVTTEKDDNIEPPSYQDLLIKDYVKNEAERVLIYGYYSSNFSKNPFTRNDILLKYEESNRKDKKYTSNLGQSIRNNIKKDFFKTLKDKEYIILEKGIEYAKEIMKGKSIGSSKKTITKSKK